MNRSISPSESQFSPVEVKALRAHLLRWFDESQRDLPWRKTKDAYRIWVSEIMLQQTRVAAVLERYDEFIRRFPDVFALASSGVDDVLAMWSGLGYYRRARSMHTAAKKIVHELGGVLPQTAEQWHQLPGVGRYTAAAIASIAFNQPCAVVDGNVERVLTRLTANRKLKQNVLWDIAGLLLSPTRPGDFNQATMELGATICLPRSPLCLTCPLQSCCKSKGELSGHIKQQRTKREVTYTLCRREDSVLLVQRTTSERLMPGMWELPNIESNGVSPVLVLKHAITDTDYTVRIVPGGACQGGKNGKRWIPIANLRQIPLTGLTRKVLRRLGII